MENQKIPKSSFETKYLSNEDGQGKGKGQEKKTAKQQFMTP